MLSVTAEYALHALTYMAEQAGGSAISGRDMANITGVPANYLSKILLSLRNGGFAATAKGSGGAFWLVQGPEAITLGQVVKVFAGPVKHCCLLGLNERCDEINVCSAHASWRGIRLYYEHVLANTTLADTHGDPRCAGPKQETGHDTNRRCRPPFVCRS